MKIIQTSLSIFVLAAFSLQVACAQHWCGTSKSDQKAIMEDFIIHQDEYLSDLGLRSGAVTYIPIIFHVIAKSDGTGAPLLYQIYNQLCKLNTDYAPYEIQFYLRGGMDLGIIYYNDDRIWNDPNNALSEQLLKNAKAANNDGINIIVNDVVDAQTAGVLGRFYRDNDYIIIEKGEVTKATTSLSHELGHFFGLSHTFFGWEITDYDCNQPTPTTVNVGINVPVEYVSRTKRTSGRLNCEVAADRLCDTGPDYNLGLGYSGPCEWNGCAKDPDNVSFSPPTENIMGYFLSCLESFSADQVNVIKASYLSPTRSYIRSSYTPPLEEITEAAVNIYPENDETTNYFDEVELEWEPVDGAQAYIVNVDRTPGFTTGFFEEVTDETSITVTGMSANLRYYWRVTPISEYHNCVPSIPRWRFRTGDIMTSTDSGIHSISNWKVSPNPSAENVSWIEMVINEADDYSFEVLDVQGNVVHAFNQRLSEGSQRVQIDNQLASGIYIIRLMNGAGQTDSKRWVKL